MVLWLALAAVAAALFLGFLWWAAATRTSRQNRRRLRAAQVGEAGAEDLLRRAGYQIEARQVHTRWTLSVDGVATEVTCRADLVVRGPDGRFVAEVKTGARAPDPTHPQTRRQLLEYRLAFDVDGVLLVDMEAGRIRTVDLSDLTSR